MTSKPELRKHIKSIIAHISSAAKQSQSINVSEKIIQTSVYRESQRIGIYVPMDDEVDTYAVIDHIIKSNKKCFIPRYDMKSRHMDMLRVHDVQEIQNMTLTKWKIRQHALDDTRPEEAISTGGLDLILVPGLAFTADGKRCGRGKGYYDTFLNRHSSQLQRRPISVALAFREQVLPDVPVDEHDYTIDHVVIADP